MPEGVKLNIGCLIFIMDRTSRSWRSLASLAVGIEELIH